MAIDDLNAKGVTIGGKVVKFELLAEDDAGDPKQGTAVAQKLADAKVKGVMGHLNSGTSIPASRIYSEAGIPQISPSATNPKYTRQGFKTAFRVVANDGQLGGTLGRYAVQDLKAQENRRHRRPHRLRPGRGRRVREGRQGAGGDDGIAAVTTDKATDFTAILTQIKAQESGRDFLRRHGCGCRPDVAPDETLGITAKFMGGDGICTA